MLFPGEPAASDSGVIREDMWYDSEDDNFHGNSSEDSAHVTADATLNTVGTTSCMTETQQESLVVPHQPQQSSSGCQEDKYREFICWSFLKKCIVLKFRNGNLKQVEPSKISVLHGSWCFVLFCVITWVNNVFELLFDASRSINSNTRYSILLNNEIERDDVFWYSFI